MEDVNQYLAAPKIIDLLKIGCKPVGLGYTFYASNTLSGMNYEGFSTIIFDEILSYRPKNDLNDKVFEGWGCSVSTILRDKPDLRIYLFGNLVQNLSTEILDYYGISVDDDFRIIRRGEKGDCSIVFINGGGLYEGSFKNQGGVAKHMSIEHEAFLSTNKIIKPTINILTPAIFEKFEYVTCIAVTLSTGPIYVLLKKIISPDGNN